MKKRIYIEHGDLIVNITKHCFFTFFTELNQLNFYKKFNWYTITPIHVFFEKDSMCKGYLFQVTLLGLGFSFRYNTKEALKLFKKWEKEAKSPAYKLVKIKKAASKKSKSKLMTGVLNEKLNVDQYKNSILYFVKYCNNQYLGKTKLNKLLYYLDFIYFRDHKSSVTGDVYLHKDYGPVPANIDEIIASLKNEGVLSVETVPHKDGEKVKFSFGENASYTDSAFNSEQKKLLKNICDEFGSWSTDKIVSQTHLEAPWFFSKPFDIVDYSYSKDIEFFVK